MDHEGYGRSDRTAGNSDIASGVADLAALAELIQRETGAARMHMMGESSGALRVGAFAMAHPDRVGRLVLQALTYTGQGSPTLGKRAEQTAYYRTHARRPRDKAMLESIFSRDRPGTTDQDVIDAFTASELPFGDSVPAGTYLDMTANLPVVHPERVSAPVLLVSGQYDGIASLDDICDFFKKLPNGDKQLTIVPGAAHTLTSSRQRFAFWRVMRSWLEA
jgi:alpha-beta hydrolase superfamily lysophospholipase